MTQKAATVSDWHRLFDAAIKLKTLAPWEWMSDEDLFGVQNPETGEIGYCCIMGSLGEHFALGVYLGTTGLAGYKFILENSQQYPSQELMHVQKCLMASFEDRDYLSTKERELIKRLGYRFRGRQAWPKFQRFDPGFYPWYLEKSDVKFLAIAIEQTLEVSQRFREDPSLLKTSDENTYFVRVSQKQGGKLHWEDQWRSPDPLSVPEPKPAQYDKSRLAKIKKRVLRSGGFVEYDYFYMPMPVQDHPSIRPYFPVAHLFVDNKSGLILHSQVEKSIPEPDELVRIFLDYIESFQQIPAMVLVHRSSIHNILQPIAQQLEFELIYTEWLTMMAEAREGMFKFWDKNF